MDWEWNSAVVSFLTVSLLFCSGTFSDRTSVLRSQNSFPLWLVVLAVTILEALFSAKSNVIHKLIMIFAVFDFQYPECAPKQREEHSVRVCRMKSRDKLSTGNWALASFSDGITENPATGRAPPKSIPVVRLVLENISRNLITANNKMGRANIRRALLRRMTTVVSKSVFCLESSHSLSALITKTTCEAVHSNYA